MSVEVCPICDIAGCRHIRERADLTAAKDARIAELERQLAEAWGVKPLEWVAGDGETRDELSYHAEDGFGGIYIVIERQMWHSKFNLFSECDSDEAAKSAAQADYTTRILSALKETP